MPLTYIINCFYKGDMPENLNKSAEIFQLIAFFNTVSIFSKVGTPS